MTKDFYLFGQVEDYFYDFELGKEYNGFLAQRKTYYLAVMKTEIEKKVEELNKSKVPVIAIDPSLGKFRENTPFPEKLAKANEMLKNGKIPGRKHRS